MDMDDFRLALLELQIVGLEGELELEPAELPGFKYAKGVKIEGEHKLLVKMDGDELIEVAILRRRGPRVMTPDEFFKEVGCSLYDGKGPRLS